LEPVVPPIETIVPRRAINELHEFRYEVGVDVFFNGRHQVDISGEKGPIHMHSWRVQALVVGSSADESGSLQGSGEVKEIISRFVGRFNGQLLNKVSPFDEIMPTSTNIARVIYEHVKENFDGSEILKAVRLWESPTSYAEYAGQGMGPF
jgi:6-pyruvoyl-tetrahydropterin synthase